MVCESGNEAFAAFSLAGLAVVMSLFFLHRHREGAHEAGVWRLGGDRRLL